MFACSKNGACVGGNDNGEGGGGCRVINGFSTIFLFSLVADYSTETNQLFYFLYQNIPLLQKEIGISRDYSKILDDLLWDSVPLLWRGSLW